MSAAMDIAGLWSGAYHWEEQPVRRAWPELAAALDVLVEEIASADQRCTATAHVVADSGSRLLTCGLRRHGSGPHTHKPGTPDAHTWSVTVS